MDDQVKKIQGQAEELLRQSGVEGEVSVKLEEDVYKMVIESQDNALLIGKHGNTLSSLEYVLSLMTTRDSGEYKRVLIEIGDYRRERESYLTNLADRLKEEVRLTGVEKKVSGLKPWERRLIHMHLSEDPEINTESAGEDRDRVLMIKKK